MTTKNISRYYQISYGGGTVFYLWTTGKQDSSTKGNRNTEELFQWANHACTHQRPSSLRTQEPRWSHTLSSVHSEQRVHNSHLGNDVVCDRRVSLFLSDLCLLINMSPSKLLLCGDILAQRWPKGTGIYIPNLHLFFPVDHALRNTKLKMLGKLISKKKKKKVNLYIFFVCLGRLLVSAHEVLQGKKTQRIHSPFFQFTCRKQTESWQPKWKLYWNTLTKGAVFTHSKGIGDSCIKYSMDCTEKTSGPHKRKCFRGESLICNQETIIWQNLK